MLIRDGLRCVVVCLVASLLGCGADTVEEPTFQDDLVPVSGVVTLDGEPAENVAVVYTPTQGASASGGYAAYGTTGPDGKYSLVTTPGGSVAELQEFSGALPGAYDISFSRMLMPDGTAWTPGDSDEGPMASGARESLPLRLTNANTSGFKQTVPEGGGSDFNFDLTTEE